VNDTQDLQALSETLISYLRARLGRPALDFAALLVQLQGGYETSTYRFELDGAPDELDRPLVLRLYPGFYGAGSAIWETTVQNGLARAKYPVARVHLLCTDLSVLGGAFFIMDHLPGQSLVTAPPESVPGLLGQAHAQLHEIEPGPLVRALAAKGIPEQDYSLASRFDWLCQRADRLPWIRQGMNWLRQHPPSNPDAPSICHGDFHPLNLLYDGGKVTGILDWGGLTLADPAYDVGNTLVLLTIAFRHVAASMEGFSSVDFDRMAERYLAAYRARRPLDGASLDYYRVRRCVRALVEGAEGQEIWQHPLIVRDLLACIQQVAGVQLTVPLTNS